MHLLFYASTYISVYFIFIAMFSGLREKNAFVVVGNLL